MFAVLYVLRPVILAAPVLFGALLVAGSVTALVLLVRKDRTDRMIREGKAVRMHVRSGVPHL